LVKRASLDDIIFSTEHENLYVIPAGPTPPNPSELLQTEEFDNFITELKTRFDYVFLDTAPIGLVSDSFALMAKSDLNLFVLRAQYSKREFATTPDRIIYENNIKNVYTILNSYDQSALVYSSLYKQEYGDYIGGGGYYYGGYYGKGRYGGYKNYNESYYTGYYSDEGVNKKKKKSILSFFTKSKK
jgi:Mrp family chromosome partitioning ATPase